MKIYCEEPLTDLPYNKIWPEHRATGRRGHGGAAFALLEAFFDAVRTGGSPPIGLRHG